MSDTAHAEGVNEVTVSPQIETEARDYGWTPQDEFRGPADKWQPADQYLDWAKRTGRLPKSEFESFKREFPAIRRENSELKAELGEVKQTLKEFVEFSSKGEQRAYERAKRELEAKAEAAAANADTAGVKQAMADIAALEPPKPAPKAEERKTDPKINPVIQDWIDRNSWYSKDRTLNGYATEVYGELERNSPGMSTEDMLAETKKRTQEKFPEKFGINPNRENARAVAEPSGSGGHRKRGRTYEDLPQEAKKACDKYVKTIPNYKREDYLRDYDWEG